MKKIGFVDFYLSECHANNYPAWINAAAKKLGLEYKVAYAWAENNVSPLDGITSEEWCKKFGAELCGSLSELCEKSDVIVVLSPSNPEKHLPYAETVLKYGKRTYIDKTFAPDLKTAEKIFELGEKYNTPFFSSSALRYADELCDLAGACTRVEIAGGGSNPAEYIIHQIEMLVKCLGVGATDVKVEKGDKIIYADVIYPDNRVGKMSFKDDFYDFIVTAKSREGESIESKIASPFFNNLIEEILRFFNSGTAPFDTEQTLEVMKIREMFIKALG